jgi:hypothetical protein
MIAAIAPLKEANTFQRNFVTVETMKAYALIAALALAMPSITTAKDHHHDSGHHHSSGHHHGGVVISRHVYPSYGYGYGGGYYGRGYGYGYPYRSGYYPYSYGPSLSFTYSSSSSPRYYRSESDYDQSSLEVNVQRALRQHGYYHGAIDGDIGPGSRSAIRAYQADRGLAVTGRIDAALLRSLGI